MQTEKEQADMIKIGFCDDDSSMLNEIQALLDQYRTARNQEMAYMAFHSSLELLAQIEKGVHFDVLFLDVIMPGENGISAAKEIRRYDSAVKIVFLTSSAEFAAQSYTVGAYFYQIKPVCEESFFSLMDSVVSACKKERHRGLILRCKKGIVRLDLDRLGFCEVIGRTLSFHLADGTVLESAGSLDELSVRLSEYENFLRPHRSFLVNMEYIQSISYRTITMVNRAEIPIPHGKCSEIKKQYLEYVFNRKQVFLV